MNENKTGKYLKYAIGEIILVVIGILIAISLNQCNSNSNEKKLVNYKLEQLRYEVYNDSLAVNQMIDFYNSRIKTTHKLLYYISKKDSITSCDSIISLINEFEQMRNVVANDGTYKDMLSTGLFSKIEDESLRQNIVDYYKNQSNFKDITWDYVKQFRDLKNDLIKKQVLELRFHQDIKPQADSTCNYIQSILENPEKKLALENYLYKGLETQESIKGFYLAIKNYLMKGIPLKR